MINFTTSAIERIEELLKKEEPDYKLRVYIVGGGCSGFNYGFAVDQDKNEDDFEFSAGAASVLVDAISAPYLENAEIDYKDDLTGQRFVITNPNARSTCGCGSSFSPY